MSDPTQEQIIEELTTAYWMEIETVTNYIANSINLDGVRAEEIKKALQADVQAELTHAQTLARRIKTLGGRVPGSGQFHAAQAYSFISSGHCLAVWMASPSHCSAAPDSSRSSPPCPEAPPGT